MERYNTTTSWKVYSRRANNNNFPHTQTYPHTNFGLHAYKHPHQNRIRWTKIMFSFAWESKCLVTTKNIILFFFLFGWKIGQPFELLINKSLAHFVMVKTPNHQNDIQLCVKVKCNRKLLSKKLNCVLFFFACTDFHVYICICYCSWTL